MKRKIGLIVNPIAGIGGAVGLKGSDGSEIQREAFERGAVPHSAERAREALTRLIDMKDNIVFYAAPGLMGVDIAGELGFETIVCSSTGSKTTPDDTERIAKLIKDDVELLVFAGGDGTARNIYNAVSDNIPVLGIPAGVKIHSAVYAKNPAAAGDAIASYIESHSSYAEAEVMDLDEDKYRQGVLSTKLYGYMRVPRSKEGFMQNPKAASHNSENDVGGICFEITDRMAELPSDICYILGAGSTVNALKKHLGFEGTLVGVDVFMNGDVFAKDVNEKQLLKITSEKKCRLIVTVIGGQGHIFGRGNQQLSSEVIRRIGLDNIWIVAAAQKIYDLKNQELYVDTGDPVLDDELRGYRRVITGWQDELICKVV